MAELNIFAGVFRCESLMYEYEKIRTTNTCFTFDAHGSIEAESITFDFVSICRSVPRKEHSHSGVPLTQAQKILCTHVMTCALQAGDLL